MFQIISYIKFLLKSSNQHGVHSPFAYDLITKCFYNSTNFPEYQTLKKYRKEVLSSNRTIKVKDFGAGSRVFKSNSRAISKIAEHAGVSSKRQKLLYRLGHYLKPANVLELGTSLGLSTAAIAMSSVTSEIQTVEGCSQTSIIAQELFKKFNLPNIELVTTRFTDFFTSEKIKKTYDFVYIDGNHDKESTIKYFELLLQHQSNDTVFIFDDIYWSKQMQEAWHYIYKHPMVTVSIDTFQWGLVFFRKEQPKQHFIVRV